MVFDAFSGKEALSFTAGESIALYADFKKVPFASKVKGKIFQWMPFLDEKKMQKQQRIFEKAKFHTSAKQDMTDVTKEIKKIKVFMRKFLTREQKFLLRYESKVDIDYKSSDGKESKDDEKLIDNMRSDNKLVQLFTMPKILKILEPYIKTDELSQFDKNLLSSLWTKTNAPPKADKPKAAAKGTPAAAAAKKKE